MKAEANKEAVVVIFFDCIFPANGKCAAKNACMTYKEKYSEL
jgi:hypothetical protein